MLEEIPRPIQNIYMGLALPLSITFLLQPFINILLLPFRPKSPTPLL